MAKPGSLQVCRTRVSLLDASGAPDAGPDNGYVSNGLISVEFSPQTEEGDEFVLKNGCGEICQSYKGCDKIKRVDTTVNLCQLDAALIGLLTGSTVFVDDDEYVTGLKIPGVNDACPNGVCIEFWSIAWDGDQQFVYNGLPAYWLWVVSKFRPAPGDFTLENGVLEFPVVGPGESNSQITADGPFDDWPAEVADTGGFDTFGWVLTTSIPAASDDYVAVTSAVS